MPPERVAGALGAAEPGRARGTRWFALAFGIYGLALLAWLGLGLLPTLADGVPAFRHWMATVAGGGGVWSGPARRILDRSMLMAKGGSVAWQYLFSLLNLALGFGLAFRRPRDVVPRLLAFGLLGTAATFNEPSHQVFHVIGQPWPVKAAHFTFHVVSGVAYLWAVVLFPDGALPARMRLSRRRLRLTVAVVTIAIALVCWRSSFIAHPIFFVVFFGIVVSLAAIAVQTVRMTDPASTLAERRAARLLCAAFIPAVVAALVWLGARVVVAAGGHAGSSAARLDTSLQRVFPAAFAVVPVVLFAAIVRYRLWDIDRLLGRALLVGSVAVVVAAAYVAAVSAAGVAVGGGLAVTVVVLSLLTVAIDPLWHRLSRWYNRLLYGQVLSPTEAVRALVDGFEHLSPAAELDRLADVVVGATRAVRAEVWLLLDEGLQRVAASPPDARDGDGAAPIDLTDSGPPAVPAAERLAALSHADVVVPVRHEDVVLGALAVTAGAGRQLQPHDHRLLVDLASHAGLIVHNALLTAQLARHVEVLSVQSEELRRSRRRVIAAQDEERQALERDLHDGAQQVLVAALIGLRTLSATAGAPTAARAAAVEDLRGLLGETSRTLAELCTGSGPGLLTERGLGAALDAAADLSRRSGVDVRVDVELRSPLPDDVAAAVYFCCLEALQNAAKHARASTIAVVVRSDGGDAVFEVADDGVGFDPETAERHSGLANLGSRLSVLGGDLTVRSAPGHGAVLSGRVPVPDAVVAG